MTPWCRQQIPVEGNFGSLFDQLNLSVDLLSKEFRTKLVLQVRLLKLRPLGAHLARYCPPSAVWLRAGAGAAVGAGRRSAGRGVHPQAPRFCSDAEEPGGEAAQRPAASPLLHLHQHLRSVSRPAPRLLLPLLLPLIVPLLLLLSCRSFSYLRLYRTDVRFDNVYVTARFRRIDARRKCAVMSPWLQTQAPPTGFSHLPV